MKSIGAHEARVHLARLLDRVARGEHFVITRHGTPVAELRPVSTSRPEQEIEEVVQALKALRRRHRLGPGLRARDLVEEGRS